MEGRTDVYVRFPECDSPDSPSALINIVLADEFWLRPGRANSGRISLGN